MIHPRKLIRNHVTDLMKTGVVGVEAAKVFKMRFRRLPQVKLPALLIYIKRDQKGDRNVADAPRIYKRQLRLVVEVLESAGVEDIDDTLDDIAREVEVLLENNSTLADLVHDVEYQDTEIVLDGEKDPALGVAVMEFLVTYEDDMMLPVADDLATVKADWNLTTEPDQQNEAQDEITFNP